MASNSLLLELKSQGSDSTQGHISSATLPLISHLSSVDVQKDVLKNLTPGHGSGCELVWTEKNWKVNSSLTSVLG